MKTRKLLPQEIEVWYLIPSLRKALAEEFITTHHLSQKKAADILNVTEAAISQYRTQKRAHETEFIKKQKVAIKKAAARIVTKPDTMMKELYKLCVMFRDTRAICDLHRNQDPSVRENCTDCFE